MARNKSEKELAKTHGWAIGTDALTSVIPVDEWTHVCITYDTNTAQTVEFNIPTERGVEVYRVGDDGKLKLLRTIKGGNF